MSDNDNVSTKKQDINDDNQHVPELRFPGFTDEWNENRLDNIFKIKAAGDLNKNKFSKSKDKNHKYPVFANALENKGLLGYYTEFKYPSGSITITARGNIGIPIKRNIEFNAVGRLLILIPKENLNISFFTSCLNNIHFYIESTGVPQLTAPSLKIYKIKYPSIKEQKKIGDFISLIDRKIDLLEKKKVVFKKFKHYNEFKLFNSIKSEPFKKVSEIFNTISQKKFEIKKNEILNKGKYIVIDQGANKIAGYSNQKDKIFENVPIICFGDHTTNIKYITKKFIIGGDGLKILKPKGKYNLKFLYYSLKFNNVHQEGYKRHYSILKEVDINIPSLKKQKEISEILTIFDKKIELINDELNIMKQFKKGLLQKMFV
ncbi:restriction endonuclease subunit S [Methanobrevibacter wolinii]|uniref:restriction endonuclease subunit S n=1 Tax=Methanobrevibacter wolinii TaxID=190977 RepID=UPI0006944EF1|nr:restriction endonuclease subunit S [Methanobrevibacter wolinii]